MKIYIYIYIYIPPGDRNKNKQIEKLIFNCFSLFFVNLTIGLRKKQIKRLILTFSGLDSGFSRFPAGSRQDF